MNSMNWQSTSKVPSPFGLNRRVQPLGYEWSIGHAPDGEA
jgi:hypothetical protein